MFSDEIKELSGQVKARMAGTGKSISTAESCTSGLIAAALTTVSGSSEYVKGGIVAYTEEMKNRLLGVPLETIERCNVVSEEVVREMVRGTIGAFSSTYGVASTGVAGPTGGTDEIPVGTIWIAAGNKDRVVARCLHGDNGREQNVNDAACEALRLLLEVI
ncbi:MAG: CinA family protein [Bacteroidaceae bacterium]|nr:CinA family protein [Bacteroidaceae bacterium]